MNKYAHFSKASLRSKPKRTPEIISGCATKARYSSKVAQKRVAEMIEKKGLPNSRAYQCPYCQKWHVTSGNSRVSRENHQAERKAQ